MEKELSYIEDQLLVMDAQDGDANQDPQSRQGYPDPAPAFRFGGLQNLWVFLYFFICHAPNYTAGAG